MDNTLLMSNLTQLVKKIILSFCKSNVNFQSRLEIFGSIHVRSDNEDVVAFVLNENCFNNGEEEIADDKMMFNNESQNMEYNMEGMSIKKEVGDIIDVYSDDNNYDNTFSNHQEIKREPGVRARRGRKPKDYNNLYMPQASIPLTDEVDQCNDPEANNYENENDYNNCDNNYNAYNDYTNATNHVPTKYKPKKRKVTVKTTSTVNPGSENSFYQINSMYTCTVCGLQFKSMDGLKCHVNSKHSQQKLYHCQFCPQTFLTRQASYSHRVKFHNINRQKQTPTINEATYVGECVLNDEG